MIARECAPLSGNFPNFVILLIFIYIKYKSWEESEGRELLARTRLYTATRPSADTNVILTRLCMRICYLR